MTGGGAFPLPRAGTVQPSGTIANRRTASSAKGGEFEKNVGTLSRTCPAFTTMDIYTQPTPPHQKDSVERMS